MAKILMIDDDPDISAAIKILLEANGHEFYAARSGEEGLRRVKEINPDLIILDVMMERYSAGFHVSVTLRDPSLESEYAAYRRVPIIVLTSIHKTTYHRFEPDEDYLPVDAFFEKSTPPDVLLAKVHELVGKAGART